MVRHECYETGLVFFDFFGDSIPLFLFFRGASPSPPPFALSLRDFDECVGAGTSTSIAASASPSTGASEPSGMNRCVRSSVGCLGRGGFWCKTGEPSGDDWGVGRVGRADTTRRRAIGLGAGESSGCSAGRSAAEKDTYLGKACLRACSSARALRSRAAPRRQSCLPRPLPDSRRQMLCSCGR